MIVAEIVEGKKSVPRNRRSGLGIVEKSLPGPRICRPGVEIVEKNRRPGPRICRPGVEIVDQVRDFIDRVRGFVDQDDEIVDQVRDFIDRVQVFDFFLAPVSPQTFQCMLVPRGKRAMKLYRGGCV